MAHKNAAQHMKTWRHKNRIKYNEYVKLQMRNIGHGKRFNLNFFPFYYKN